MELNGARTLVAGATGVLGGGIARTLAEQGRGRRRPGGPTTGCPSAPHIMPWRIEDEVRKLGANGIQAGAFRSFAIRDGNLVTGQQNFSGAETARLVLEAVGR